MYKTKQIAMTYPISNNTTKLFVIAVVQIYMYHGLVVYSSG